MINVMDSIEAQYTILGFKQMKAAIKETFLTSRRFMEAALTDEKMKKFGNVKQQLVRVQNKERCTMMELLLTQHCCITITYLNSLSKTTNQKEILISNSLFLKSSIGICYAKNLFKGDSITAFLVEHNDVLYKVIKPTTSDKRFLQTRIFTGLSTAQ
jgi:hypothetical protein